jgi:hypothetical protein
MTKARGSTKKGVGGPYLEAAFICELVLQDKDGAYSAIRMVNRITLWEVTSEPEHGALLGVPLMAVVSFKAGDVQEAQDLYLYLTSPAGKREPLPGIVFPITISFEGGDTGTFLALGALAIRYEGQGTYWIDVRLGQRLAHSSHAGTKERACLGATKLNRIRPLPRC